MTLADLLPYGATGGASGGVTFLTTRWWNYRLQTRKQTDHVLGDMVTQLRSRVSELEGIVRALEHELRESSTEADSMFWLLKYVSEDKRAEAVADIERERKERADRKGEERQTAQRGVSLDRLSIAREGR